MKYIDAIFCADLHLMERTPLCRLDEDFLKTQEDKVNWIIDLQDKYKCPVFIAGDIFDVPRLSKESDIKWIQIFRQSEHGIIAIPGQHDLPNHNIKNLSDSSLGVVAEGVDNFGLRAVPFGTLGGVRAIENREIGMIHKLIHDNKSSRVKAEGKTISYSAKKILRENLEYDVIVSGDNHMTFVVEYENRLLVNPGSMMRIKADQIDHRPCVFLYDADQNKVFPEYFSIDKNVVTREHIEKEQKHDERMDAYIEKLSDDDEEGLNFSEKMKSFLKINKVKKSVKDKIWEFMEE